MNYDEMVKCAYEDIVDSFEKEAANRLYRDGVDSVADLITKRRVRLEKPIVELDQKISNSTAPPWRSFYERQKKKFFDADYTSKNYAARNAYLRGRDIDDTLESPLIKRSRSGMDYYAEKFKKDPSWLNRRAYEREYKDIKHTYNNILQNDLSNRGKSIDDIKRGAWDRMQDLKRRKVTLPGQQRVLDIKSRLANKS